jgi:hypothetical protein
LPHFNDELTDTSPTVGDLRRARQALAIQPQAEAQPGVGELVEALRAAIELSDKVVGQISKAQSDWEQNNDHTAFDELCDWTYDGLFASYHSQFQEALSTTPARPRTREAMVMTRVYAQDTKVPAYKSENEIREMLRSLGADRFAIAEVEGAIEIRFAVGSTVFQIARPDLPDIPGKTDAQRERVAWRALVILVKAKKVAIDQGVTTVEREFMADTMLPHGAKLIDHYEELIESNYQSGVPQIGFDRPDTDTGGRDG